MTTGSPKPPRTPGYLSSHHTELWGPITGSPSTAVPAAESLSAQTAAVLVDPALGKGSNPAVWDPHALAWIPGTSSPAEAPADA
jgi:hypothetical protein